MTDYANLDYPNNLPLKLELIRLINFLNVNKIHYWVDFATLAKITSNSKYLNYLSCFDICVFEDSYNLVTELIYKNNFYVWQNSNFTTTISTPDLIASKKSSNPEIIVQRMLKWVTVWNYKLLDKNQTSLKIDNDFIYNKEIFLEVEEIEYCGIKLNIPKNIEQLNTIRYPDSKQVVWCHSPKKRENSEKNFGFCNLGAYK
jgi:hypothetical protein